MRKPINGVRYALLGEAEASEAQAPGEKAFLEGDAGIAERIAKVEADYPGTGCICIPERADIDALASWVKASGIKTLKVVN